MSSLMKTGAEISEDGLYRFTLTRQVESSPRPALVDQSVLFLMNNPSTADTTVDDPTIRRCTGFARGWGYGWLDVGNVNPTRATDPKDADIPPEDVLEENEDWLRLLAFRADLIVAAWGAAAPQVLVDRVMALVEPIQTVKALALTKAGQPRHPLYLKADLVPFTWWR